MRKLLVPLLFTLAALSCYSDSSEVAAPDPVDLDTIDNFDEDLNYAQVVGVKATLETGGAWRFDVTVRHNDEGWDHYSDLWEVVDLESSIVYGERVLLHPHESEQPFTRSQTGVEIADGVTSVLVRAKCNKHGFLGQAILVDLEI